MEAAEHHRRNGPARFRKHGNVYYLPVTPSTHVSEEPTDEPEPVVQATGPRMLRMVIAAFINAAVASAALLWFGVESLQALAMFVGLVYATLLAICYGNPYPRSPGR